MDEKTKFILNSFSKISHKKWELYCVTRIINKLDDLDVEFKCQQPIRTNQKLRLADIYFPQINLYVEVNESHHDKEKQKLDDRLRDREIFQAIGAKKEVISVQDENQQPIKIHELNIKIDSVVNQIKTCVQSQKKNGEFVSWDEKLQSLFNHQHRSQLDVFENISVRRQVDAINLFGANYKGWQSGEWPFPDGQRSIWFPRFYKHKEWTNSLSDDGKTIKEKKTDNSIIEYPISHKTRIVFGRYRDQLGNTLYVYSGEFKFQHEEGGGCVRVYTRIAEVTLLSHQKPEGL